MDIAVIAQRQRKVLSFKQLVLAVLNGSEYLNVSGHRKWKKLHHPNVFPLPWL